MAWWCLRETKSCLQCSSPFACRLKAVVLFVPMHSITERFGLSDNSSVVCSEMFPIFLDAFLFLCFFFPLCLG